MQARIIKSTDVRLHYSMHEFDPWSVAGAVRCPLSVVEELASRLPAQTTRRVRLPGARHTIFRDRPDLAFPAVRSLASQIRASQPAD